MENTNDMKETRLVFQPQVARKLCKMGFPIIDIKPLKTDKEKTVFVFNNTSEFQDAFGEVMSDYKAKKESEYEQLCMYED